MMDTMLWEKILNLMEKADGCDMTFAQGNRYDILDDKFYKH